MRRTLEGYKEFFKDKLQQDISGKGLIYKNSEGLYIAYLKNKQTVSATSFLKELGDKIIHFSKTQSGHVPNYSDLLNAPRPSFL